MAEMSPDLREEFAAKADGQHAANAASNLEGVTAKAVPETKVISLEECKQHTREDDCWLVIHGKVLDVTAFLDEHPGGFDILISSTGGTNFGLTSHVSGYVVLDWHISLHQSMIKRYDLSSVFVISMLLIIT